MPEPKLGAIILAAGCSSRMQAFKPLQDIGGKTFIEHAVGLFQEAGVEQIITVVGHRAEQLIPRLDSAAAEYVLNSNYRDGMFSSVRTGVARRDPSLDAFFLLPVDIPLVQLSTIQALIEAFHNNPSISVCYPQDKTKRGHPPLINCRLAGRILDDEGENGLRGLLRQYDGQALDVPVEDPFIHMDADSPQDLDTLRTTYYRHKRTGQPSFQD